MVIFDLISIFVFQIIQFLFSKIIVQSCPNGFTEGTRTQDDENDENNSYPQTDKNTLPKKDWLEGSSATKWYFCCGSGEPTDSISFDPIRSQLPDNFTLFRKGGSCQVINGRTVQTGWIQ